MTWDYPETPVGHMNVVISVPASNDGERFPVLVALHGRGEAFKGPERGARGWIDDYGLTRALAHLKAPPLVAGDFGNMVEAHRLAQLNRELEKSPYAGLVIVCPYTPDILAGARAFSAARPLAEFIVDRLLPRVLSETPADPNPSKIAIDGVSLGGRASLLVGLERPKSFGVVGALQAAIDQKEIAPLVERARRARQANPALTLRLLTSRRDYFLREVSLLSDALTQAGIPHLFSVVQGDHSYEFNRGPGVYELLTFHNWALRGKPTPLEQHRGGPD